MTNREQALERLEIERSTWFAKLEVAGTLDADQPGFWGEQSLRDLLVHLNFWQSYKNDRLRDGVMGETTPRPWPEFLSAIADDDDQVNAINAYAQEQADGQPASAAIADSQRLWNEQFAIIEGMPSEILTEPNRFPMFEGRGLADALVSGYFFEHYHDEHGAELSALTS